LQNSRIDSIVMMWSNVLSCHHSTLLLFLCYSTLLAMTIAQYCVKEELDVLCDQSM